MRKFVWMFVAVWGLWLADGSCRSMAQASQDAQRVVGQGAQGVVSQTSQGAQGAMSQESTELSGAMLSAEAHADGWDGDKYYKNGVPLTGLQKIGGNQYYFSQDGKRQTGWHKIGERVYYFSKKGDIGAAYVGKKRIQGERYYFGKQGVLKTGFRKLDGKRFYFRETGKLGTLGKTLQGLKKVGGNYYYFRKGGAVTTGWKSFAAGKSYFDGKGVRVSGVQKIDGKWYFFDKKGILQTKTDKEAGVTYYINAGGYLEAYQKGQSYFHPDGEKMDALQKEDYVTLNRARAIVREVTTAGMSQEQKLERCFAWVMSKPYIMRRRFQPNPGWPALYANDHFVRGGGPCHADGAAFAYLARAIGYEDVYVCLDGRSDQSHAWTEINGKVYDPLFAQAKSYAKNYGASYAVYGLSAIMRFQVAVGYAP